MIVWACKERGKRRIVLGSDEIGISWCETQSTTMEAVGEQY